MKKSISVIVPVYNVELYIDRCLNSIINQTFKDIEIILVDDGSTDSSGKICDDYKNIDERVIVIHKENGGLSSARNAGLDIARGEYISFIDSDDWIDINMFADMYKILKETDVDICECKFIKTDGNEEVKQYKKEVIILDNIKSSEALYSNTWYGSTTSWNKLYKADLFEEIRFPSGKINEDQFVTPQLYLKSRTVAFTNQIYYYYYQSPNSITRSAFNIKKLDALIALKESKNLYKENNLEYLSKMIDETYSYALIKYYYMLSKEKEYDDITDKVWNEYKTNFKDFIFNKYINYKYKIYLIIYRLNPKLFFKYVWRK